MTGKRDAKRSAEKSSKPKTALKRQKPATLHFDESVTGKIKGPGGRPTKYVEAYAGQAEKLCALGATDAELADFFEVDITTIWRWSSRHEPFCSALRAGKAALDDRVERSLFQRSVGYTFDAVKIFMPAGAAQPVMAPYREHVPPDPGAAKLWLCCRRPDKWRDKQILAGDSESPVQIQVTWQDKTESA